MYNQEYINSFSLSAYKNYLINYDTISEDSGSPFYGIADNYLRRNSTADSFKLAFKESLDHYVLKRLMDDEDYINHEEFKGYIKHMHVILLSRVEKYKGGKYFFEPVTNIVFSVDKYRDLIFNTFYNEETCKTINFHRGVLLQELDKIINKIDSKESVTQEELNFLGEYIYTSRNYNDGKARKLVEYIFNEITTKSNIKMSVPLIGAISSYIASTYSKDKTIAETRCFVGTTNKINKNWLVGDDYKFCHLDQEYFLGCSLLNDDYLYKKAYVFGNDLYHLLTFVYHDLTHKYQKLAIDRGEMTSGGVSFILKDLQGDERVCKNDYITSNKRFTTKDIDSTSDFELETDEEVWYQAANFVREYCNKYAVKNKKDIKKVSDRELQCRINESEFKFRRLIAIKKLEDNGNRILVDANFELFAQFVKQYKDLLDEYPALDRIFNEDGEVKVSLLFDKLITTNINSDLKNRNTGREVASYIVNYEYEKVVELINLQEYSEEQIKRLIINISNVIYQNVCRVRAIDRTKRDLLNISISEQESSDMMYDCSFMNMENQICNAMFIFDAIIKKYPQMSDIVNYQINKCCVGYTYELFPKTNNIGIPELRLICNRFDKTDNQILKDLSMYLKKSTIVDPSGYGIK